MNLPDQILSLPVHQREDVAHTVAESQAYQLGHYDARTAAADLAKAAGFSEDLSSLVGEVIIDYTNWRGERGERVIRPIRLWWGQTRYHPNSQFLLAALDVERNALRDFAMADIHSWKPRG